MGERKVIAVVGATGAQGGGLVRAILADESGEFAARALTRDPNSDKARQLRELGAEVVAADVGDEQSLRRAFQGAYGAFCVTFFWEHFSPTKELAHATAMARAAKAAGVRHVIWSTLEDTRQRVPLDDDRMPTLQDRYKVPHFDAKGEADDQPADLVLLGQHDLLRHGAEARARREARHYATDGRQETARDCSRRHRQMRLRDLPAGPRLHRQDHRHRRRPPHRRRDGPFTQPRDW
jgi:hypothetical protein